MQALSTSFPFTFSAPGLVPGEITLDVLVHDYLPSWPEAVRLCELYMEQAPWFFGAVTKRQLAEEILPLWYDEAPKPPPTLSSALTSSSSTTNGGTSLNAHTNTAPNQTPHDLALLFIILCYGALTDTALPAPPDNPESDTYYQLTKAALALAPVLERPTAVATVQALSLMAIYEGMAGGENSIESTWALMGLSTKLAQSVSRALSNSVGMGN